jgi:hypothetical protein
LYETNLQLKRDIENFKFYHSKIVLAPLSLFSLALPLLDLKHLMVLRFFLKAFKALFVLLSCSLVACGLIMSPMGTKAWGKMQTNFIPL